MKTTPYTGRQLTMALLQLAVIAPVLWRASTKETNTYFRWGLRLSAGMLVFANMDAAGKALQTLAAAARPSIPFLGVQLQAVPPRPAQTASQTALEGELMP